MASSRHHAGFFKRIALGHQTGQSRACNNVPASLIRRHDNGVVVDLHAVDCSILMLASTGVVLPRRRRGTEKKQKPEIRNLESPPPDATN
jgi:hypothetical protein